MKKEIFGTFQGKNVSIFTITDGFLTAKIIEYGATLQSLTLKDESGKETDVILGYNTLEEYVQNNAYLGATIGRVANRIANGKFHLNGVEYDLVKNEKGNSLHGGEKGFNSRMWAGESDGRKATFTYKSPDGEEGYPGTLDVKVVFSIIDGALQIEYFAKSDKDTILSPTNHAYFNLNGECKESVFSTKLWIDADRILDVDENLLANGETKPIQFTVYDFSGEKEIGNYFEDPRLIPFGTYDVCYVLKGDGFRKVATAKSEKTGIEMEVFTDMPGLQLYTEAILCGSNGKKGKYGKGSGFCFETQRFQNSINCQKLPSPILRKGEKFYSKSMYKFTIKK